MNRSILAASAASLLLLAACGSDSDDATSPGDTTADSSAPVDGTAAACDAWIDAERTITTFFFTGQGDVDAINASLDAAIAAAPPDRTQPLTDLKSAVQPQLEDPETDSSDETDQLYADQVGWVGESCDVATLDVSAKEYQYGGIPETLPIGYTVVNFSNVGNEAHEMFAFRINDDVTDPVDDLLSLPEDEAMAKITPVNAVFAMPGTTEAGSFDLQEAGRYAVVCFIPTGTTADTEGTGPPHFTQGMIHEFTVTT